GSRTPQTTRRALARISFSHGAEWEALISRYIVTIPLTGDTCAAEQSISAGPPPRTPVSSAMMAKVGDAARASPSAAQSAPALRRGACPSDPPGAATLIAS